MFLSTVTTGLVTVAVGVMSEEEPEPPPHEDSSTITKSEQKYFIVSLLRDGLGFLCVLQPVFCVEYMPFYDSCLIAGR